MEDQYLDEVSKYPLLTSKEERELARMMKRKNSRSPRIRALAEEARQKMITSNLRLVIYCVNKVKVPERHRCELIQEGNMGLMIAVERFDPEHGTKFSTYAIWWIKQRIRKAMPTLNEVGRLPQHIWDKFWRNQRTGEATAKAEDLKKAESFLTGILEVDESSCKVQSDTFDEVAQQDLIRHILEIVDCLYCDRTREIILMRFGVDVEAPMTLEQIGQRLGITKERVRQIEAEGLEEIRTALESDLFEG